STAYQLSIITQLANSSSTAAGRCGFPPNLRFTTGQMITSDSIASPATKQLACHPKNSPTHNIIGKVARWVRGSLGASSVPNNQPQAPPDQPPRMAVQRAVM